jgi:uncharacterized protein
VQPPLPRKILGQNFWLSAERCMFWEEKKSLIVSDLHIGKSGHFRKAGIAVPQTILQEDLQRLFTLINFFKAEQVIVVGDFFHSTVNLELDLFKRWRNDVSDIKIILVKGNHDILKRNWYSSAGIELIEPNLCIDNFCFSHDLYEVPEGLYTFSGHIHPGIIVNGLGRQSLRFPCFYFTSTFCVLPAFGKFTGLANIDPSAKDDVFAVVHDELIEVNGQ